MKKVNKILYPLLFVFVLFLVSWSFDLKYNYSEKLPSWIVIPFLIAALVLVWRYRKIYKTIYALYVEAEQKRYGITEMYEESNNKRLKAEASSVSKAMKLISYSELHQEGDPIEVKYNGKLMSTHITSIKYETELGKKLYESEEIIKIKNGKGE